MDYSKLFESLVRFYEQHHIRYVLIGGFALQAYGYVRATRDIDFAVARNAQPSLVSHLQSLGFTTLHRSDAFSNHLHEIGSLRIDVMYLDEQTAQTIFSAARAATVIGTQPVQVVAPQHLIAMKLFAAHHDKSRTLRELADIREVLKTQPIDPQTLRTLFQRYHMDHYLEEVTDE